MNCNQICPYNTLKGCTVFEKKGTCPLCSVRVHDELIGNKHFGDANKMQNEEQNERMGLFRKLRHTIAYLIASDWIDDLENRLSTFLCNQTGGRLSKCYYSADTMITAANDYQQSICDECDMKIETAREIFAEIEFDIHQLMFERDETRAIAIEGVIANLKRKYCGEVAPDTNDGRKKTNFDRIKEMTVDEMAKFIPDWSYTGACKCGEKSYVDCNNECENCVKEWLESEVNENG